MLDQRLFANIDWTLCFIVLLISGVGLIALSSATLGIPGKEDYWNRSNNFNPVYSLSALGTPWIFDAFAGDSSVGSCVVVWNRRPRSTCTALA